MGSFIKEGHNSDENNENKLRKMQIMQLDMLKIIHRICMENDITYYLFGGTLIGAVRHKGFIPWDDDVDIAMPRADYIRFEQIANKKLPDNLRFFTNKTDKGVFNSIGRVKNNDTKVTVGFLTGLMLESNGIWIDVFPLDEVKNENNIVLKFQIFFSRKILRKIVLYQGKTRESCKNLKQKIIKGVIGDRKSDFFVDMFNNMLQWGNNKEFNYYIAFASKYHYKKQVVPKEVYGEPIQLEFEGHMFNAPNNYDYLLTRVYGDYMKMPDEAERIGHEGFTIEALDFNEEVEIGNCKN